MTLTGRWRSNWHTSLVVEVVNDNVELRQAQTRPRRGVLYRRLDRPQEPMAVRTLAEFKEQFRAVPVSAPKT